MADEATGALLPIPQGMVVSERAKMTLRQGLPQADTATIPETNIATHVANSSSRSSANIRDLVKLGVRDIEIIQGTGTEQANNVSPQVQLVQSDGAPAAVRAQLAETSPEGNAPGSADRRAQAHEIRMRAIERQVVAAVRDGADTIRMQLYPPGLGQIVIRLSMDGSKLKMVTKASSAEAADSLRSLEGDLRDALSTGGLELAGFDVSDEGERDDPRRGASAETEETKNNSRSAKSENFALDMNA
jgi:flagellar hook-length control protein FliK